MHQISEKKDDKLAFSFTCLLFNQWNRRIRRTLRTIPSSHTESNSVSYLAKHTCACPACVLATCQSVPSNIYIFLPSCTIPTTLSHNYQPTVVPCLSGYHYFDQHMILSMLTHSICRVVSMLGASFASLDGIEIFAITMIPGQNSNILLSLEDFLAHQKLYLLWLRPLFCKQSDKYLHE